MSAIAEDTNQDSKDQSLERELQSTKDHAAEQGQQVEYMKKELGTARKEAEKVPGLERQVASLKEDLQAAQNANALLTKANEKAVAQAEAGDSAVAAGKQVADGLRTLGAF